MEASLSRAPRSLALLVVVLTGSHVIAAEPGSDDDTSRRARSFHDEGVQHYQRGEYAQAAKAFKAAYELAPTPGLLFNIAQALRFAGPTHCGEALRLYMQFLKIDPDSPNRATVLSHLPDLERCTRDEEKAAPTPPPPPMAVAPVEAARAPPAKRLLWPPLLVAGVGLAALGTGVGLFVESHQEFDRLLPMCAAGTCAPQVWQPYERREQIGVALMAAGGGLAAIGGAWAIAAGVLGRKPALSRAWVAPTFAGVVAGATF